MQTVYAVVRLDMFLFGPGQTMEKAITIKEVLPNIEAAKSEVERLNALNADKDSHYFWQSTHFYPEGRDVDPAKG